MEAGLQPVMDEWMNLMCKSVFQTLSLGAGVLRGLHG